MCKIFSTSPQAWEAVHGAEPSPGRNLMLLWALPHEDTANVQAVREWGRLPTIVGAW